MDGQQWFLSVFLSGMCLASVPGLVMHPTAGKGNKQSGEPASRQVSAEVKKQIPDTRLNLTPSTKTARQKIQYARKININRAGNEKLQEISGIGPATAEKIINFRNQGNHFYSVEDMKKISGIGPATVKQMRPHVTVGRKYKKKKEPTDESGLVDLNKASLSQLKEVTGIGPATARNILTYRKKYGGFRSPSDLKNVTGIGPSTYRRLRDKVKTSTVYGIDAPEPASTGQREININDAGKEALANLPGVGPVTAESIIRYRQNHGPFSEIDDLEDVSGLGPATVDKLRNKAVVR